MSSHDLVVLQVQRRLLWQLLFRQALPAAAAWCFFWGTAILVLRVLWSVAPLTLLWGFAGVVPVVALAVINGWRRLPTLKSLHALVDSRSQCGGFLVAADEQDLGDWRKRVPAARALQVTWRNVGRAWVFLGAALVYAAFALLLPERVVDAHFQQKLQISKETDKIGERIDLLKEEKLIEEDRAAELQKQLDQIKDEASGRNPDKTFQALDHLLDMMKRTANDAGEKGVRDTERLAKAESLAEAMQKAGDIDSKVKAEAMSELKRLLEQSELENAVADALEKLGLQRELDTGSLTPEQMKKLAELMKGSKKDIEEMLKKLANAELVDAEFLKQCEKCGKCNGDLLAKLLGGKGDKEGEGDGDTDGDGVLSVKEMLALCQKPGRGGVSRGRGDAALTYGDESNEQGMKFKEEVIPPGSLASLKDAKLLAISRSTPRTEKDGAGSTGGALNNSTTGGGAGVSNVLLPQHRGVVQRYFERKDGSR